MEKPGKKETLWPPVSHAAAEEDSLHNSHLTEGTAVSGMTQSSTMGSIPLQPGELVAEPYERPLSAPPPPGFGADGPEERTRKASELIMRPVTTDTTEASSGKKKGDSSNSFSNLAAFFGTGLAQSMEDATHENPDALFHPANKDINLNFHRQSRHAGSRLLGAGDQLGLSGTTPPASNITKTTTAGAFSGSYGFPTSLSSPQHGRRTEQQDGQQQPQDAAEKRGGLPSRDIGTKVNEPEGETQFGKEVSGVVSSRRIDIPSQRTPDQGMVELERGLQTLLSSNAREFRPAPPPPPADGLVSNGSSVSDSQDNSEITSRRAFDELQPYMWEPNMNAPSRTLAIFQVSYLRVPDVRSSCETFGVLESFRADFASRGFYFVSYYDIRSAQYAAAELQSILQRLSVMQRSSEEVVVRYCLPLNSSSQFDESQISISELPPEINEYILRSILSSYGSIRSVIQRDVGAYDVEFHSIQDTKQAQLELESSQPFGPNAFVEICMRNSGERKRGRALLAMIGRWRQGLSRQMGGQPSHVDSGRRTTEGAPTADPWRGNQPSLMTAPNEALGMGAAYGQGVGQGHRVASHQETTQLVLGPDGRYTPVVVQNHAQIPVYPQGGAPIEAHQQQQLVQGPNGQMYLMSIPSMQHSGHMFVQQQPHGRQPQGLPTTIVTSNAATDNPRHAPQTRTPYYAHVVSDQGSLSGRSHRSAYSTGTEGERDNRHLMLDLDAVELGDDTRTSLMVRNIPNKYTQQMLLSEFEENGHGPGVIDFFYLPIDFKNRCNRGYAFINFVEYRDILAFHQRYFGKHWRTFNSDKICDITYARIQGKAAMLKRFENSALMEKDDEYKPLVFVSSGRDKGKRLPFPDPSGKQHGHI